MKRRELLWMILPCIALALIAIVLSGRPGANLVFGNEDDFALVVEKFERETPTPYEVWQGYDSKWNITLSHHEPKPMWWGQQPSQIASIEGLRLVLGQNERPAPPAHMHPWKVLLCQPSWDGDDRLYYASILMRLADVPQQAGRVFVEGNISIASNNNTPLGPKLHISHPVREAGEVIRPPVVSRDPDCEVENIVIRPVSPLEVATGAASDTTRVEIAIVAHQRLHASVAGDGILRDDTGKAWPVAKKSAGSADYWGLSEDWPDDSRDDRRYSLIFDCALRQIPLTKGRVWLETKPSFNNAWPLSLRVPIRDAQGKIFYTPFKPAPLKVLSTRAHPPESPSGNTVVEVTVKYTGPRRSKGAPSLPWKTNWSQHVVDEGGRKYWTVIDNTARYSRIASDEILEPGQAKILYDLVLKKIPPKAGRLTFKAEIGLPGTRRIPVSVVVRDK